MLKLTPIYVVDEIEPCLSFWEARLGFKRTIEVPHDDRLGFIALESGAVEIMYQTRASIASEGLTPPPASSSPPSQSTYIQVADIQDVVRRLEGVEIAMPLRKTFYGSTEVGVREPAGNLLIFAQMSNNS